MKKLILMYLTLLIIFGTFQIAYASEEKSFNLISMQKTVKTLTEEYDKKKLYDTSLTSLSNQIIRLNKEISSGKNSGLEADIKATLKDANTVINKLNTTRLSVYAKKTDTTTKSNEGINDTNERIAKIKNNLDKAMVYYGLKPKEVLLNKFTLIIYPCGPYGENREDNIYFILDDNRKLEVFCKNSDYNSGKKTLFISEKDYGLILMQVEQTIMRFESSDSGWDDVWYYTLLYKGKEYTHAKPEASDLKILADMLIKVSGFKVDMYGLA